MLRKTPSPGRSAHTQEELQVLYARREAIDSLIQSLQKYDRFRVRTIDLRKPKSA
jgi:hypothetical protein